MPIKFTAPSYTVVGICIGKARDVDGEGTLPTSPPIHHSFFEDTNKISFKERSHQHIYMLKEKHLN